MNPERFRKDFPVLAKEDAPIYFDNACMTLKPKSVIDAIHHYYTETPFCAGRSTHRMAAQVEEMVTASRNAVARLVHARSASECVFLRNTTEGLNLVANGLRLPKGSTVLTTDREHNSNLVPWQRLARDGVKHEVLPSTPEEGFDLAAYEKRVARGGVSVVSVVHASNLDGYVTPLKDIARIAHDHDAVVVADGAQFVPHHRLSVRNVGVDFYAWSVHKMMGPSGMGVLWGTPEALERLEPHTAGGGTIADTTYETHKFQAPPNRFEAGLQDYAGIIGTRAAVEYLERVGAEDIEAHERALSTKLRRGIEDAGATLIGARDGGGIVSFAMPGLDIHQLAVLLEDKGNVLVRAGFHCNNSWFNARGIDGSCRASLYLYNTEDEVEACLGVFEEIKKALRAAP